jgi:hypothetical protein
MLLQYKAWHVDGRYDEALKGYVDLNRNGHTFKLSYSMNSKKSMVLWDGSYA